MVRVVEELAICRGRQLNLPSLRACRLTSSLSSQRVISTRPHAPAFGYSYLVLMAVRSRGSEIRLHHDS